MTSLDNPKNTVPLSPSKIVKGAEFTIAQLSEIGNRDDGAVELKPGTVIKIHQVYPELETFEVDCGNNVTLMCNIDDAGDFLIEETE